MKKITLVLMLALIIPCFMNAGVITKTSSHSATLYYVDADGDGYGSSNDAGTLFNEAPLSGYSLNNDDCDDSNNQIHPGVTETCNSVDDDCNGVIDESQLNATVFPEGTITYCQTLTLEANRDAGVSYKWCRNSKLIPGETNATCTITKGGNYAVLESAGNCVAMSGSVTAVVVPLPPAHIAAYGLLDLCNTGSVLARANGGGDSPYKYQWLKSGLVIQGATSRDITITCTGQYSVVVSNSENCSKTSLPLTVISSCREGDAKPQDDLSVSIYPNPSNGNFNVEMNTGITVTGTAHIEVMNVLNQVVTSVESTVNDGVLHEHIQLGDAVTSGSYFVRVIMGGKTYTGRIIYQKQD